MNSTGTCKWCGKEILWAQTSHGKNIPLDPKSSVFSVMREGGRLIAVRPVGMLGEQWLVSHLETCTKEKTAETLEKHFSEPKETE